MLSRFKPLVNALSLILCILIVPQICYQIEKEYDTHREQNRSRS